MTMRKRTQLYADAPVSGVYWLDTKEHRYQVVAAHTGITVAWYTNEKTALASAASRTENWESPWRVITPQGLILTPSAEKERTEIPRDQWPRSIFRGPHEEI